MIYEKKAKLIVMLCNIKEKERIKCARYWPSKTASFNNFSIDPISINEEENLVTRKFTVKDENSSYELTQMHFISWPDHGIPEMDKVYNDFKKIIEEVENQHNEFLPVVVHCSAGIGRTGTFISFYNVHNIIKNFKKDESINLSIFNLVRKLKEQRMGLVENVLQYKLIYSFLDKNIKKILK